MAARASKCKLKETSSDVTRRRTGRKKAKRVDGNLTRGRLSSAEKLVRRPVDAQGPPGPSSQAMEADGAEARPRPPPADGVVVDLTNDSGVEDNDVIDLTTPVRVRVPSVDLIQRDGRFEEEGATSAGADNGSSSRGEEKQPPSTADVTVLDLDDDVQLISSPVKSKKRQSSERRTSYSPGTKNPKAHITCPICLDSVTKIEASKRHLVTTTCGHIFCDECISLHLGNKRNCPTCRSSLSKRKIHPLFLS